MLSVPLKVTNDMPMQRPMQDFLIMKYSGEEAIRQQDSIQKLQQMRAAAAAVKVAGPTAVEPLARYLNQISLVETKFPVSATETVLNFQWNDSLVPRANVSKMSWNYERACILYNIGALESQAGAVTDRGTDSGVQIAAKAFLSAAAVFQHIRDTVVNTFGGTLPTDLKPAGLNMVITLMQAQAQSCFYEKASAKGMMPSTLAMIAMKASELYAAARDSFSPAEQREVDRAYPWTAFLNFQSLSFKGCAYLQQSKAVLAEAKKTTVGYGTEITMLGIAEEATRNAVNVAAAARLSFPTAEALHKVISARRAVAIEENNSVYMNSIPSVASVPKIEGRLLAKMPPVPDYAALFPESEVFSRLVPAEVTHAVSEFEERMTGILTAQRERCTKASDDAKAQLADQGLPAAVDASESASGLPDTTWAKVEAVQVQGGLHSLELYMAENQSTSSSVDTMLTEIGRLLADEEARDAQYRSQYGGAWTSEPSSVVSAVSKANLEKYTSVLRVARDSDSSVSVKLTSNRPALDALGKTRGELSADIPSAGSGPGVAEAERARLKESLKQLGGVIKAREQLLEALKKAGDSAALSQTLAKAGLEAKEAVFTSARAALEPHIDAISGNLASQGPLLERIHLENLALKGAQASDESTLARQAALQRVEGALNKFDELMSNLKEGKSFYGDLTAHVKRLKNDVEGMVTARDLEQKELLLNLRRAAEAQEKAASDAAYAASLAPPPAAAPSGGAGAVPVAPPGHFGAATAPTAPGTAPMFPTLPPAPLAPVAPPGPTAPGPAAAAPGTPVPSGSWRCAACTFVNQKPDALACELCGTERA